MADPIETRAPVFSISMLIYDTRYRSITIQIIALMGLMLFFAWLINNTVQNMSTLGRGFSFDFLGISANYDINQRLLDYSSLDTNLRAAILGLLNTLILAFAGCVLATILGVLIGVLRLSKNWLISTIMAIYIEMFRNIPVLLWILLIFAVLIETLPAPNAFRGAEPQASMLFNSFALTNRGIYTPEFLFAPARSLGDIHFFGQSALRFDISLDFIALLLVLIFGFWASARIERRAVQIQKKTGEKPTVWYWRIGAVVIPFVITAWALGLHLGYPELKGFNFKGGTYLRNSYIALWLALSFYTASHIAELVRAGILSVSKGQSEAAASLGLKPNIIMRLIILPQALRVIVPPTISNYLNLTKNSSLAIAVGYMDITGTLGGITLNQTGRELECLLLLMIIYLIISLSISAVMNIYDARNKLAER